MFLALTHQFSGRCFVVIGRKSSLRTALLLTHLLLVYLPYISHHISNNYTMFIPSHADELWISLKRFAVVVTAVISYNSK